MDEVKSILVKTEHGERQLAALVTEGRGPALVWLGGFRSDMTSTKAAAIAEWGRAQGRKVVRFDYSGHGASSGRFEDGSIGLWLDDAIAVIEAESGPSPVLVGSSMGGWIALLAARMLRAKARAAFPSALLLIAPAVDFTEVLIWARMPDAIRSTMMQEGQWLRENAYGPPYPITRKLIEEGRQHLMLGAPFEVGCPVHVLQGLKDVDVPAEHALTLIEHLTLDSVTLTTVPDGDHRLSREEDIALLLRLIAGLADQPQSLRPPAA
jgi:pimeloyl-ACP methyl ester carboxylesterase